MGLLLPLLQPLGDLLGFPGIQNLLISLLQFSCSLWTAGREVAGVGGAVVVAGMGAAAWWRQEAWGWWERGAQAQWGSRKMELGWTEWGVGSIGGVWGL